MKIMKLIKTLSVCFCFLSQASQDYNSENDNVFLHTYDQGKFVFFKSNNALYISNLNSVNFDCSSIEFSLEISNVDEINGIIFEALCINNNTKNLEESFQQDQAIAVLCNAFEWKTINVAEIMPLLFSLVRGVNVQRPESAYGTSLDLFAPNNNPNATPTTLSPGGSSFDDDYNEQASTSAVQSNPQNSYYFVDGSHDILSNGQIQPYSTILNGSNNYFYEKIQKPIKGRK